VSKIIGILNILKFVLKLKNSVFNYNLKI